MIPASQYTLTSSIFQQRWKLQRNESGACSSARLRTRWLGKNLQTIKWVSDSIEGPICGEEWRQKTQNCSMLRGHSQFMVVIYFRKFLELDLVCLTWIQQNSNIWFIVTFTKLVISFMESMAHTSHLWTNINHYSTLNLLLDHQILFLYHPNLWQEWKETDSWTHSVTVSD
jgi:hypothetical protein